MKSFYNVVFQFIFIVNVNVVGSFFMKDKSFNFVVFAGSVGTTPVERETMSASTTASASTSTSTTSNNACMSKSKSKSECSTVYTELRGGGIPPINTSMDTSMDEMNSAEMKIRQFLSSGNNDNNDNSDNDNDNTTSQSFLDKFHFHGWRWHTLSIIRDSSRLERLSHKYMQKNSDSNIDTNSNINSNINIQQRTELSKAIDHVVDFNLKGLQRIESNVFFPWLKEKLTKSELFANVNDSDSVNDNVNVNNNLNEAFQKVIDGIERDKKKVITLADNLRNQGKKVKSYNDNMSISNIQETTIQIQKTSQQLSSLISNIFEKEVTLLAPAVAKLIPAKEQIKVNTKILRNLGIFESRAILVGMYETIHDEKYGNEEERALFDVAIPYIPRKMISRWKKTLYEPQAGMLEP